MPTTIKDIARQAGVSHTTVSRALNHSPLISLQTTERIQQIASQLGYHPSVAARSLKTNRSQVLGVIVSHIADPYFSEVIQGIDDVAQKHGYSLFIASAQNEPLREHAIIQAMREHRVDGVILCSPNFAIEQSNQLNSYNIPIVALNNQAAEDYRFSIYHDDVDGSKQACQHLIELGHTRIAFLGNCASGRTGEERLAGFYQGMQDARIPICAEYIHQVSGNGAEQGLKAVDYFINLPVRPTALICYNDLMAMGVLKGLHMAGLRVPRDISVTGFDNILYSDLTEPPLTTIDQPKRFLGGEAARMIFSLINSNANTSPPELMGKRLKGMLIIRRSTASPGKE